MTPANQNTYFSSFLPFNKTTDTLAAPIPSIINADFISNLTKTDKTTTAIPITVPIPFSAVSIISVIYSYQ